MGAYNGCSLHALGFPVLKGLDTETPSGNFNNPNNFRNPRCWKKKTLLTE
jgi:hypothetical protein